MSGKPPKSTSFKASSNQNGNNNKNEVYVLDGSKKNPYQVYNSIDRKSLPQPEYDLNTIIKSLDDGFYMSRTQVRYAFTLYLSKIQLRLVIESEVKDESNTQQMVCLNFKVYFFLNKENYFFYLFKGTCFTFHEKSSRKLKSTI
jgi:hypothetical protein